jgi:RNA polymerase sigma factor (sigma-70 family)
LKKAAVKPTPLGLQADKNLTEKVQRFLSSPEESLPWRAEHVLTEAEERRLAILAQPINSEAHESNGRYTIALNADKNVRLELEQDLSLDIAARVRYWRDRLALIETTETKTHIITTSHRFEPSYLIRHGRRKKPQCLEYVEVVWLLDDDPFKRKFPDGVDWEDFWQLQMLHYLSAKEVGGWLFGEGLDLRLNVSPEIRLRWRSNPPEIRKLIFTEIYVPMIYRLMREHSACPRPEEQDTVTGIVCALWEILTKKALKTWDPAKGSFGGYVRESLKNEIKNLKRDSLRKKRFLLESNMVALDEPISDGPDQDGERTPLDVIANPEDDRANRAMQARVNLNGVIAGVKDPKTKALFRQLLRGISPTEAAKEMGLGKSRISQMIAKVRKNSVDPR